MFGILVASGLLFGAKVAMNKAANDGLDPVAQSIRNVGRGRHLCRRTHGARILLRARAVENRRSDGFVENQSRTSSQGGFGLCLLSIWFFRKEGKRINAENRALHAQKKPLLAPMFPWAMRMRLEGFCTWLLPGTNGLFFGQRSPWARDEIFLGRERDVPVGPRWHQW